MKLLRYALLLMGIGIAPALADESTPLLFTRTHIAILRQAPPSAPALPWQNGVGTQENPAILFDIELRDAMTLYNQQGWFSLSSPSEKSGIMMVFSAPGIAPITRRTQYAPLDILLVDEQGKITQIVPNIVLADLSQEIIPSSPVLAFLFIKGGTCEKLSIAPGDYVEYKLFKKPPIVLNAPKPISPTQPAPAPAAPVSPAEKTPAMQRVTPPGNPVAP